MPLSPKTRLGTYEIVGLLGIGGMGEVYRAKDLRLGREVAVKVLSAEVDPSPDRLARFEREARAVAGLNHPNIVTLFSVEDEDGVRFLTMELVEGGTLANLVTPGGLPLQRILELAIPLTDALVAAHERGVIHRDLKPGNVMVTRDGRVKVLDFGLAKLLDTEGSAVDASHTVTADSPISGAGELLGTIPYMAPEQLRGETVDARSDLFSLGIILYELSTGRRPFTGETSIDVGHAILRETPEPLSRLRMDLPAHLERIVSRCLQKNPRERTQTALDVSNELRSIRRTLEHGEAGKPAPTQVASIAVLPFVNRSANADDEYFSEGLADELLGVLAKIKGLRVSARASSFHFKGKDVPLAEIGKALNVATVLDGSVRKSGNRVRISVQLVKTSDGYHLWSETYDRTLDDIFAVQDDIAQSVVKELRTRLLGEEAGTDASGRVKEEVAKAAKGRTSDPEAHRLYLQARNLIDRGNAEDNAKGVEYLRQALDLDPKFALAWAELGWAHSHEADLGWASAVEGYGRAREAVERALSLAPDLADGHSGLAWIRLVHDWDWGGAESSLRRALELAPGDAEVLRRAGELARSLGRMEEAIGFCRRALEQDPLNAAAYYALATALYYSDRFTESESAVRKTLELTPQRAGSRATLSMTLLALGRGEEALAEATRETAEWARLWSVAIIHHAMGRRAESDVALQELIEQCANESAAQIAEVYAARGEPDAAFEWLERAYAQRDSGISDAKSNSELRSLHKDPRWHAFMKKLRFEE